MTVAFLEFGSAQQLLVVLVLDAKGAADLVEALRAHRWERTWQVP